MLQRGYWQIGRVRGIPVRLHWSIVLGAMLFSGMTFAPVFWLSFFGLVLAHEFGHALLVRRFGHQVLSVDVTGFGGLCRWAGHATEDQRGIIAWGGVAAQVLVLMTTLAIIMVTGWPTSWVGAQLASVLVRANLWLIVLNLIPIAPFDGADAWRFAGRQWRRMRLSKQRLRS